jgi:ParB/RepB/Spo0J family partition protein
MKKLKQAEIPLELIDRGKNYRSIDPESLAELAANLRTGGVLYQPIGVYAKEDGRFELIFGERRVVGAIQAGWKQIWAVIFDVDRAKP